ncbi:transposase [uncultured Parabacteroides sp.]|jgi:putative transposase|uniref:transposase n=1 Tax=uncultured Parabacteroides sp. TaxID=512312 RepID=UPI0025D50594|nr:transposase [uncultured Parabacteroides sp.]
MKQYNPDIHHRHSIRLQGYDYSQEGLYFITMCVQNRKCIFGEINNGEMILNDNGKIIEKTWLDLPNHNPHIELNIFCIMPNHIHAVIEITAHVGAGSKPAQNNPFPNHSLSEIVRQFKTFSSRHINQLSCKQGHPVWQRNYYEHIIRNEISYNNIYRYIMNNPQKWEDDKLYWK